MQHYELGIAWNWKYDEDFVRGLEHECAAVGVTTYRVESHNVKETLQLLRTKKISFGMYFDRASDDGEEFQLISNYVQKTEIPIINNYDAVEHAKDKATMHLELLSAGIHTPYTIIISPYNKKQEVEFTISELAALGRPFIIKPANTTGGGIGVVMGAETLKDIIKTRQHHKNDKYLLQETMYPVILDNKQAWFRIFYAFGEIILCWWDTQTHRHTIVTFEEEQKFALSPLRSILKKIQRVCKLDFFSSEIALVENGKFVAIDYVNEVCDMRLQSKHFDGVPDDVVLTIQQKLAVFVKKKK